MYCNHTKDLVADPHAKACRGSGTCQTSLNFLALLGIVFIFQRALDVPKKFMNRATVTGVLVSCPHSTL
jgi:hypothetical protein